MWSNAPHRQALTTKLNHLTSLANWLSVRLWTKWLWVRVQLQSLKLQIPRLLWARSSLTFRQLESVDTLWNVNVTWQEYTVCKMRSFVSWWSFIHFKKFCKVKHCFIHSPLKIRYSTFPIRGPFVSNILSMIIGLYKK